MTKTSRERRHFPVPMRCPYAGNDPSRARRLFGRRLPQRVDRPASRRPKTCTTADVDQGKGLVRLVPTTGLIRSKFEVNFD
jgi:hypothetical protein